MNARRALKRALYGAGGAAAFGLATRGLLNLEASRARKAIGEPTADAPRVDGLYGSGSRQPLRMLVLGDSLAAGLGVQRRETLSAVLAAELAKETRRPVHLVNVAKVGAESQDLPGQLAAGLESCPRPDVSVIVAGVNDLTHGRSQSQSAQTLADTTRSLRTAGSQVVVGTCPDLGTVEPLAPPLRQLAGRVSARYATQQAKAAGEAGAHVAPLGELLGKEFARDPKAMFGPDRFHPSARGYATGAYAMMPAVRRAAGIGPATKAPTPAPSRLHLTENLRHAGSRLAARSRRSGRGTEPQR